MTTQEKDKLIEDFFQRMLKMKDETVWKQSVTFTNLIVELVNKVEGIAKIEGFNEGFKEGKKQYEKTLGKLN